MTNNWVLEQFLNVFMILSVHSTLKHFHRFVSQEHFYLETQATVAVPKGEDNEMELFVSTQNPTYTQVGQGFSFSHLFIYLFAALLTCTGTLDK